MSIWHCEEHGLGGGNPCCGKAGRVAGLTGSVEFQQSEQVARGEEVEPVVQRPLRNTSGDSGPTSPAPPVRSEKLWLDDVRQPPDDTWCWVKSARECIAWLDHEGPFSVVSLDHDLEDEGYAEQVGGLAVVRWLTAHPMKRPPQVLVHSMNPVGAANMRKEIKAWVRSEKEPELLPCPFCGGKAIELFGVNNLMHCSMVRCDGGCGIATTWGLIGLGESRERWNRRSPASPSPSDERCSECDASGTHKMSQSVK